MHIAAGAKNYRNESLKRADSTLKALVYEGVGRTSEERWRSRDQDDEDIIVRVTTTSICGSDLHLIHGMIPDLPRGSFSAMKPWGLWKKPGKV